MRDHLRRTPLPRVQALAFGFAFLLPALGYGNESPTAIALGGAVSSLAEDSNTSDATKLGDVVITDPDGGPLPAISFSTNTGSLSNDVLTLLNDKYADIPASTMGNWGTESFEFSVSIKSADGGSTIAPDGDYGALIQRSSSGIGVVYLPPNYTTTQNNSTSSYDGPQAFLWNNGQVQFRVRDDISLLVPAAVSSWSNWVNLKLVLDADSTPKTLKIFVDDVEKGSLNVNEGNWNNFVANKDTFTSMWMRLGAHWKNTHTIYQNLNAQIKDLYISGINEPVGNTVTLSGPDAASFEVVGSELFLKAGVTLDHEVSDSHTVTLTTGNVSVTHTLSITDVNEAPVNGGAVWCGYGGGSVFQDWIFENKT